MPRTLADGHEKIAILTEEPVDPAHPTVDELEDGIDAACSILESDWTFGPTDSATFAERAVCEENDANAYGPGAFQFGATVFRYFASGGAPDTIPDALFTAVKVKGSTIWVYCRKTSKLSTAAWVAADEIRLGAQVLTDTPQDQRGGYVKYRVPGQVQKAWPFTAAAAGA
jgi:hypothetical protein